jgi:hypothetical protein
MNLRQNAFLLDNHPTLGPLLRKQGWSLERRVDPLPYCRDLELEGIQFNGESLEVLASFGGLVILPAPGVPNKARESTIVFRPFDYATGSHNEIAYWKNVLRRNFSPVGYTYQYYMVLVDDEGGFYAVADDARRLGNNITEALECVLL